MTRIELLQKQENEIRDEMILLYNEYNGFFPLEENVKPFYKEWLKMLRFANELRTERFALEEVERKRIVEEEIKQLKKVEHKFINSFGEATSRYITTTTYERQQKRLNKEIDSFLGIR